MFYVEINKVGCFGEEEARKELNKLINQEKKEIRRQAKITKELYDKAVHDRLVNLEDINNFVQRFIDSELLTISKPGWFIIKPVKKNQAGEVLIAYNYNSKGNADDEEIYISASNYNIKYLLIDPEGITKAFYLDDNYGGKGQWYSYGHYQKTSAFRMVADFITKYLNKFLEYELENNDNLKEDN